MSPNRACLGREVRLHADLVVGTPPHTDDAPCVSDLVQSMVDRMRSDGVLVRAHLGRTAAAMKARYDTKVRPAYDFQIGDSVWYFHPRRFTKRSPKCQNMYVGPCTVTRLLWACNVEIRKRRTSQRVAAMQPVRLIDTRGRGFPHPQQPGTTLEGLHGTVNPECVEEEGRLARPRRQTRLPAQFGGFVRSATTCDFLFQATVLRPGSAVSAVTA